MRGVNLGILLTFFFFLPSRFMATASAFTSDEHFTPSTLSRVGPCISPTQALLPTISGGPTNNFLRLETTAASSNNAIVFNRTDPGLFSQIVADFDFRMTPAGGVRQAEGLLFALLNTAHYGATGEECPTLFHSAAKKPTFKGSLGIGFDIIQKTGQGDIRPNSLSVYFDKTLLTRVDVTPMIDLASGEWIHAKILMMPGNGSAGNISVLLTPPGGVPITAVDRFPIPGFTPYEGRLFFSARSDSFAAYHDLGNIRMQFAEAPDPTVYGQWSNLINAEIVPIHMHLLPTGKVLFWQNGRDHNPRLDEIRLWDPITELLSTPAYPEDDLFCSGHAFLANGDLLVTGGHIADYEGISQSNLYNPFADFWTRLPNMNAGRWYPTNTTLANGDLLVISGDITKNNPNKLPQVWQAASRTWRDLTNAQRELPNYPFMFVAPDGKIFNAGPKKETAYLDTSGLGSWTSVARSNYGYRIFGSSVMYDDGKIMIVGGGGSSPTNTAEIIDLNVPTPSWQFTHPMAYARNYLNATLLPDGMVLVTGGTESTTHNDATGGVRVAEVWNPETGQWTTLAGMHVPRVYHSTALLLPDGRVLTGGGGRPTPIGDVTHRDFEIYSPPYLFGGTRPTITTVPAEVTYGETFFVQTPDAARITHVHWIRLSSVTHAFNQNQRINKLTFSQTSGGLNVTAPSNANLAPAGHYMLFILDNGVPSVAQIIRVDEVPSTTTTTTTTSTTTSSTNTTTSTTTTTLPLITCYGLLATIVGTPENDVINGTPGRDVIVGLSGNDKIKGNGGDDIICGGFGNDTLYGGDGNDILLGEEGKDALKGGIGNDMLAGGNGKDKLKGDAGDDTLDGGADKDRCYGGTGTDSAVNCEKVKEVP